MTGGDCIIESGAALLGMRPDGSFDVRPDTSIVIRDGRIAAITDRAAETELTAGLPRFGGPGLVAMPGLVNSHHHSGITPLMHGVPFAPLEFWLPNLRAQRAIPLRLDTLYSAIEMLESGTTTVHHIHGGLSGPPEGWGAQSREVIAAYREIGMRVGYSFMMRDRKRVSYEDDEVLLAALPADAARWLAGQLALEPTSIPELMQHFRALAAEWAAEHAHVRLNLAPANLHWLTDAALVEIFDTARTHATQLHMHLVETERQARFAHDRHGHSAVAHLHALGCLGPNLTLGHGNWLDRADLDLLAEHSCCVCHNASSGLRLGSGIAPVNMMLAQGLKVALGIDQSGINDDRDMLAELKLVFALHRETGLFNPRATPGQILQMATEHGARTAGFGSEIGRLEVGRAADIVLLDRSRIERPAIDPRTPLSDAVVLRATARSVEQVFVGGEMVVDAGRVIGIDRDAVMQEVADQMTRPLSAAEALAGSMVRTMLPTLMQHTSDAPGLRPYRYNGMAD